MEREFKKGVLMNFVTTTTSPSSIISSCESIVESIKHLHLPPSIDLETLRKLGPPQPILFNPFFALADIKTMLILLRLNIFSICFNVLFVSSCNIRCFSFASGIPL